MKMQILIDSTNKIISFADDEDQLDPHGYGVELSLVKGIKDEHVIDEIVTIEELEIVRPEVLNTPLNPVIFTAGEADLYSKKEREVSDDLKAKFKKLLQEPLPYVLPEITPPIDFPEPTFGAPEVDGLPDIAISVIDDDGKPSKEVPAFRSRRIDDPLSTKKVYTESDLREALPAPIEIPTMPEPIPYLVYPMGLSEEEATVFMLNFENEVWEQNNFDFMVNQGYPNFQPRFPLSSILEEVETKVLKSGIVETLSVAPNGDRQIKQSYPADAVDRQEKVKRDVKTGLKLLTAKGLKDLPALKTETEAFLAGKQALISKYGSVEQALVALLNK
jgi:hypothetical protein